MSYGLSTGPYTLILVKPDRRVPQRLFPNGTERCPVKLLKKLISVRPTLHKSGPLYLRPLQKPKDRLWYSVQPVGENKIKTYMKTVAKMGGIDDDRRFTNHSIRKTTVRKLQNAGISKDKIASITGHKSEESLRDYDSTDMRDHKKMSMILSNPTAKSLSSSHSSVAPAPEGTTVRKLQNSRISSITGQRREESLRDYASTDIRAHKKMRMILSNPTAKSLSSSHPSVAPAPEGTSYHGDRPPLGPVPQYVFNNCTVYMGTNNKL